MRLRLLDLFSGIGGFSLGLERSGGFETVAFCEIDPHCKAVLQDHWPKVPIYDDVRKLTAGTLRSDGIAVDAICGGFPCQDVSIANVKGRGLRGERSGLWFEYARLIGELRPRVVIVENVAELLNRGMGDVLGSLAAIGYDAEWRVLRGLDVGLPFIGERLWIVATPYREGRERRFEYLRSLGIEATPSAERRHKAIRARHQLEADLHGLRVDDGLSVAMERRRLQGLGNAVTPDTPEAIGRAVWRALTR
ncbi:MAG: DNA cytosine methyltransferase [Rhodomicrobium sp.]